MKVFLSNTPSFIIHRELQQNPVKQWIYLGTNPRLLKKLRCIFDKRAEHIEYGEKLYDVSKAERNHFIQWIDEISYCYPNKKEWLFSVSAVKNTFSSNLFLYICYFFVLRDFIEEEKHIDFVFVDSPALVSVLKCSFPDQITVFPANGWLAVSIYFKRFIRSILRFCKYLIDFARKLVCAKIIFGNRSKRLFSGKDKVVLIRNFITGQFSDSQDDIIEKHFLPRVYDYLTRNNHTPVFLPTVLQTTRYWQLFRKVSRSRKAIIFAEEFLGFRDYLYAFLAPMRALTLKLSPPPYSQYPLGHLLKEDYYSNLTEFGLLYGMLLSCLGKRFKKFNLRPQGIINWTENLALERGLIKGLRENFPGIRVIGTQPFIFPRNNLPYVFSVQEKEAGLLPDKVLVLGPIGKEVATEFIKDINVAYSPAFRYRHAFSNQPDDNRGDSLLVLLGYDLYNAVNIMRILLEIDNYGSLKSFKRILVKLHPAGYFDAKKLVKKIGQNLPGHYKFVNGQLEQYLNEVSIGICGASGTSLELVVMGIPVIAIGEPYALTMDYLGYKEDRGMWRLCFSHDQIIEALNHFKTSQHKQSNGFVQKAYEFRNAFIAQPDDKYWKNFLLET